MLDSAKSTRFPRPRTLACLLVGMAAGMAVCKGAKSLPDLTLWPPQSITLAAISFAAVLASWYALRRADGLRGQIAQQAQRHQATLAVLQKQEEQYRLSFENATHGIYRTTPDGLILLANPALLQMLGYGSFEELARRNLEESGTEAAYSRGEFKARLEAAGEIKDLESQWARRDGSAIFVRENARVVRGPDGSVLFYEGSVEDVTFRRQAEEALRASEARFQRNVANVPGMVYQLLLRGDGSLDFPYVSDGCREIYHLEPDELQRDALSIIRILQADDRHGFRESLAQSAQTLQPWKWEGRLVLPSGEEKWVQGAARPERQANGDILWDGLVIDVTARRVAQAAIQQAHDLLEVRVQERTEELAAANQLLEQTYDATIEAMSHALDLRDHETEGHSQRVTEATVTLAHALGFTDDALVHVRRGALLHDIGKMGVPDAILLKPGPLDEGEWAVMKCHPSFAGEMLSAIAFLRPALDIPLSHHEKWDGTGYPHGLKGAEIPLAARLFAVVDVWDALCSDRPYRKGWPEDRVRAHIASLSGSHFDPIAAAAFLQMTAVRPEVPFAQSKAA